MFDTCLLLCPLIFGACPPLPPLCQTLSAFALDFHCYFLLFPRRFNHLLCFPPPLPQPASSLLFWRPSPVSLISCVATCYWLNHSKCLLFEFAARLSLIMTAQGKKAENIDYYFFSLFPLIFTVISWCKTHSRRRLFPIVLLSRA